MSTHRNINFTIDAPKPIDSRMQVINEAALNGIAIKYDRMKVYALAEDTEWRYFAEDFVDPWHEIEEGGGIDSVGWEDITGDPSESSTLVTYLGANQAPLVHEHVPADITPSGGYLTWDYPLVATNFILTGSGLSTPGAVNRYTDLVDTDPTLVGKALLVPEVNAIEDSLVFIDYRALVAGRLDWKGRWVNASYFTNDVVIDGSWTMVANKNTTERAGIIDTGTESYAFGGTLAGSTGTAKQLVFGNRITATSDGYIKGYRFYANIGQDYTVFSVIDPLGTPIIGELLQVVSAAATGWVEIEVAPTLIDIGTVIDIIAVTDEPDGAPTTFNGNWNYLKPTTAGIPATGEVVQSSAVPGDILIHKTDNDSTDRSANLATMSVGDKITTQGLIWNIQKVTDNSTYYTYQVVPVVQAATAGVYNFVFDSVASVSIDYDKDTDYWQGNANRAGLYILGGRYEDISPDDNAYGTDILIQNATIPTDWDVFAFSGDAVGAITGGDPGVQIVDNLTTQDSSKALSANMGYVVDQAKYDKAVFINVSGGAPSAAKPVITNAVGKIDISFIPAGGLPTTTVDFPVVIEFTADVISKGEVHSMHGAFLSLITAQPISSGTPINVTSGISKLMFVAKAGSVVDGNVTFTGTKVDRDTGVETASYADIVPLSTLATDTSAPDSLGHNLYNITDAITSSIWFKGAVVITVNSAILTDVDVYQVAYEQFNDEANLTINSIDFGFSITNAAAEMNAHLYAVEVGANGITSITSIVEPIELTVADSEANKYYRIRRGSLAKSLDGSSDGIILDMHLEPDAQPYFEQFSAKVWASVSQDVTIEAGIQSVTGDGVDNTDSRNPVMDLDDWLKSVPLLPAANLPLGDSDLVYISQEGVDKKVTYATFRSSVDKILFGNFTVYGHEGDATDGLTTGNIVQGWWSATEFWIAARYDGGDPLEKTNYTILNPIEDL